MDVLRHRENTPAERRFDEQARGVVFAAARTVRRLGLSDAENATLTSGFELGDWEGRGRIRLEGAGEQVLLGYRVHLWVELQPDGLGAEAGG